MPEGNYGVVVTYWLLGTREIPADDPRRHRSAYDRGADFIVNRCLPCRSNVEIYEGEFKAKFGSNFEMPVVYYGQLLSVAYDRSAEDSALDVQLIKAKQLEGIAAK